MKVTLESTTKVVELNGVPARIWEGETESGIKVHAYITRIALHQEDDQPQFAAELSECRAPSPVVEAIPPRLVLRLVL